MQLLHILIFGIVEGVTEFLPISSTGHLMLTAKLLQISQTEFIKVLKRYSAGSGAFRVFYTGKAY